MDKNQAQKQIRDIFQNSFHRETYQYFLRNLLNQIEPRDAHYTGNLIPDSFREHVTQYWRVGKYIDPDGLEMDLLVVEVKSLSKLDRARSALRNFAVNRLKQFEKDCSLVAFYAKEDGGDDWRFSFVKIEHEAHKDEKGKIRLKAELTPAKRCSYLVGVHENSHTACQQLMPLLVMDYANPRIEEIEKAFSIEKVTDEFFEQYKGLYLKLSEQLKGQAFFKKETEEENTQTVARFAKKLLGQIVFLYFLQKKGWLGVAEDGKWGDGSRRFMRDRFIQVSDDGGNYYHDFLQYLFYEALAKERKNQTDPDYYERFSCKIPFLNGGLFEAEYDDWHNLDIDLPNSLFHNDEKNVAGDVGTGILDVFDRYNFTIKEDEPLEKEVAVDPEMLGKVFENMLEVTERKSKGAFYTPREIVYYMCQESLINYLDNSLNFYAPVGDPQDLFVATQKDEIIVLKADLETFIRKGHLALENDQRVLGVGKETDAYRFQLSESVRTYAKEIDQKLADIRVCDPAIGSGAFPVGLLHEIVSARLALAPHSCNSQSAYELKRHTIRESLYGVDIDSSAIDVARLRLWLSLMVDEDDYCSNKALPNLDYKIVCGNSLLGFPENWKSPAFDYIEDLKRDFHDTTDQKHKQELKKLIEAQIRSRLTNSKQVFGYQVDFDFKLFFSEVWDNKAGFDVVIGNPPYMIIQTLAKAAPSLVQHYKDIYSTATGKFDIYCLFTERGTSILNNKGILNYIMPSKWTVSSFGKGLRKYISDKQSLSKFISFGSYQVFNASTYTSLLWLSAHSQNSAKIAKLNKDLMNASELGNWLNNEAIPFLEIENSVLSEDAWVLSNETSSNILDKIAVHPPVSRYLDGIFQGIVTGDNDAFWLHDCVYNSISITGYSKALGEKVTLEQDSVKPLLYGKTIAHHSCKFDDTYIIYPYQECGASTRLILEKQLQEDFPLTYAYLSLIKNRLSVRGSASMKYPSWYSLWNQRTVQRLSAKNKILTPDVCYGGSMWIDRKGLFYHSDTTYAIIVKAAYSKLTSSIYAVLNSSLLWFYLVNTGAVQRGGYFRFKTSYLKPFPFPEVAFSVVASLDIIISYIEHMSTQDNKSMLVQKYFDLLSDSIVLELYFLTEIKAANKGILKHLGNLKPITDDMSDEEKLAVIQSEFDRLYDPKHPVRNNLETLDSVEEVRIIREALKK